MRALFFGSEFVPTQLPGSPGPSPL